MVVLGSDSPKCILCKSEHSNYLKSTSDDSPNQEIVGIAKTSSFKLPWKISQLILENGMELGHADDFLFNRVDSKRGSGIVGILTSSTITRSVYYDHALKLALIPFIWPEHYIHDM